MAATSGQISGDVIDAIRPDLEAFASLWSALRTNYQGTNITKTVARLLHMYQPEDGVLAYERLLRTLYVLLEDFDGDGLRLLVSMVPPPKGVADEIIKEVFHKATGFVRLNAPIFHRNSNSTNSESDANSTAGAKSSDFCMDSRGAVTNASTPRLQTVFSSAENAPQGTTILRAIVKSDAPQKTTKSPKVRPKDSEVFRGFPSNEITNTQSHAKNMTHFYGPSSNFCRYPQRYVDYRETQPQNFVSSRGMDPSAYKFKWLESPMLLRKNNYDASGNYPDLILKTSDNKFIRLPITKINGPPIGNYNSSYNNPMQTAYQAYYQNSQLHLKNNDSNLDSPKSDLPQKNQIHLDPRKKFEESEKSADFIRAKFEGSANPRIGLVDHDYDCLRSEEYSLEKENYEIGNLGSPNHETIEKFRDTVKNSQRAIQEDIYRMDVVRCDDDVLQSFAAEEFNYFNVENLTVTDELKKAAGDFLKRAEEEEILESSAFPKTRILQDPENYPALEIKSSPRTWKMEKPKKCGENSEDIKDSSGNFTGENVARESSENSDFPTKNSTPINQNLCRGNRGKMGRNQTTSRAEKASQKITNFGRNSSGKNCAPNSAIGTTNENIFGQISASPVESVIKNKTMHQANSVADLVNYRKQYYDALLSIQRAKVAVANSLAISSSQTSTSCDTRVFQYLQQQHQLLQQQQQRLLMRPQHPVNRQAFVQPNLSNMRGAAALWIRGSNDWKYSPCGQYAFPRQAFPVSSSASSSSCPAQVPINASSESSISDNCPRTAHHLHRTSKPAVKRRKLEDIVGKLKDTDEHN